MIEYKTRMSKPYSMTKAIEHLLGFSLRSLRHPYGQVFLRNVLLQHPIQAVRGLATYARSLARSQNGAYLVGDANPSVNGDTATLLVGTGFCQKPLRQAGNSSDCPSGRFNHECVYLNDLYLDRRAPVIAGACAECTVRPLAEAALRAGASFAILTSAWDIAHDILLPALEFGTFRHAMLSVCPYSVEPIRLALATCGLSGSVFAYHSGDCADYEAWLRADAGDKPERTVLSAESSAAMLELLHSLRPTRPCTSFRYVGHIYRPCS